MFLALILTPSSRFNAIIVSASRNTVFTTFSAIIFPYVSYREGIQIGLKDHFLQNIMSMLFG